VLESEHPTTIHEIGYVHVLVLEFVDEFDPIVISVFNLLLLFNWERVDGVELVKSLINVFSVVFKIIALGYLSHKYGVHHPRVEHETYSERDVS
jgi:hypothetical protein